MPHRIHKCTNTLYDYARIINTYVSLIYKLEPSFTFQWFRLLGAPSFTQLSRSTQFLSSPATSVMTWSVT
jgi:hypothetical protein